MPYMKLSLVYNEHVGALLVYNATIDIDPRLPVHDA